MQYRTLIKNRFTTESYSPKADEKIVFISYRRKICDKHEARKCAEILEDIDGLHYWIDEEDKCMQEAHAENDDVKKALCIEKGLDVSSALLGIIGPRTFTSPWIPYEIGGARGRQRYAKSFGTPHPLIAHYIHEVNIREVPAFVALGYLLTSRDEVQQWAESITEILQKRIISVHEAKSIHARHDIQDIYEKNVRLLKPTPLY